MLSSTSSSNRRLPLHAWSSTLLAFAITAGFIGFMEWRLAVKGFLPTVVDNEELWQKERRHASKVGERGLILVGASRMQLDVDLSVLRRRTRLEPIQLAIDGTSYWPIFEGLAKDPTIKGTVLVDYVNMSADPSPYDTSSIYQKHFEQSPSNTHLPDFSWSESRLSDISHRYLRSYADGARPVTSFLMRVLLPGASPQYLVTLPDRSRLADYRKVLMPNFYFARVMRNLGITTPPTANSWEELEAILNTRIDKISPPNNQQFISYIPRVLAAAKAIEARGGRVIFTVLPTSKLVRKIDERSAPRKLFFDRFALAAGQRAHHFADSERLSRYDCPDGSHLDLRDRTQFTEALVDELHLDEL